MNKTLLNLILATLPSDILKDLFFQNLINTIDLDFKICGKINVNEQSLEALKIIAPHLLNLFDKITNKDELLNLCFYYPDKLLFLSITKKNNNYEITLKTTSGTETKIVSFILNNKLKKIKTTTLKHELGLITDYKSAIYLYDNSYQKIKGQKHTEEISTDFANLFFIPQSLSLFFYLNFHKYYKELNKYRLFKEMELEILTRPINQEYELLEPMKISALKTKIHYLTTNEKQREKLNRIINEISKVIDKEEIVISKLLFESILKYILDFTQDMIYTSGIIITKEYVAFNHYKVTITALDIIINKSIITPKEAQELFLIGKNNQDKPHLEEFFGLSKTR